MRIGLTVRMDATFADTVERTRSALQEQGFGVLTEIDVQQTLREKLGEEMDPEIMVKVTEEPELRPVAEDAGKRLKAALDTLVPTTSDDVWRGVALG